jgi:hypothetical protein
MFHPTKNTTLYPYDTESHKDSTKAVDGGALPVNLDLAALDDW